jgi:hypothetical protein
MVVQYSMLLCHSTSLVRWSYGTYSRYHGEIVFRYAVSSIQIQYHGKMVLWQYGVIALSRTLSILLNETEKMTGVIVVDT